MSVRHPVDGPAAAFSPEVLHGHSDRVPDERRASDEDHFDLRLAAFAHAEDISGVAVAGILDAAELVHVNVFDDERFGKVAAHCKHDVSPVLLAGIAAGPPEALDTPVSAVANHFVSNTALITKLCEYGKRHAKVAAAYQPVAQSDNPIPSASLLPSETAKTGAATSPKPDAAPVNFFSESSAGKASGAEQPSADRVSPSLASNEGSVGANAGGQHVTPPELQAFDEAPDTKGEASLAAREGEKSLHLFSPWLVTPAEPWRAA